MAAAEQNCEFAAAEPFFRGGLLYPAINTFEVAMWHCYVARRKATLTYQGATDYAFRRGH
jgi:hypothetical protein